MNSIITKDNLENFTFQKYRKTNLTSISDQTLLPGTKVQTLEGEWVCNEPSRLALDNEGNVYPIAESIFKTTYIVAVNTKF